MASRAPPSSPQERPEMAPRGAQTAPTGAQDASKRLPTPFFITERTAGWGSAKGGRSEGGSKEGKSGMDP
eukprot:1516668-Pyramimonas_sp.AAC.2